MTFLITGETMVGPEATTREFYLTTEPENHSIHERDIALLIRELHPGTWVRAISLTLVGHDGEPLAFPPNPALDTPWQWNQKPRRKAKTQTDKHPTLF